MRKESVVNSILQLAISSFTDSFPTLLQVDSGFSLNINLQMCPTPLDYPLHVGVMSFIAQMDAYMKKRIHTTMRLVVMAMHAYQ